MSVAAALNTAAAAELRDEITNEALALAVNKSVPRNFQFDDMHDDERKDFMRAMVRENGPSSARFPQELLHGSSYPDSGSMLRDVWRGWMGDNNRGTRTFLRSVVGNSSNILSLFPLADAADVANNPRYAKIGNRLFSQTITMTPGVLEEASRAPVLDVEQDVEMREQNFGPLFKDNFEGDMDFPVNKASADKLRQRCEFSAKSASITWEHQAVAVAAQTARDEQYAQMVRKGLVRQHIDAFRRYVRFINSRKFALMKDGTGFFGLLSKAVSEAESDARPTHALFPHGTSRGLLLNSDALNHAVSGPRTERAAQGVYGDSAPSNLTFLGTTLYGIRVAEVMPFRSKFNMELKHPLERLTYTSQFFLMSGRQSEAPAPHRSVRDITVMDMNNGTEATLTFEEALFNCAVYEPNPTGALTVGGRAILRLLTRDAGGTNRIDYQQLNPLDESHASIEREDAEELGTEDAAGAAPWRTEEERVRALQETHFARLFRGDKPDAAFSFQPSDDAADTTDLEAEDRVSPVDKLGLGVNLYNMLVAADKGQHRVLDLQVQHLLNNDAAQRALIRQYESERNGNAAAAHTHETRTQAINRADQYRASQLRPTGRSGLTLTELLTKRASEKLAPSAATRVARAVVDAVTQVQSAAAAGHSAAAAAPPSASDSLDVLDQFRSKMVNAQQKVESSLPLVSETATVPRLRADLAPAFAKFSSAVHDGADALQRGTSIDDYLDANTGGAAFGALMPPGDRDTKTALAASVLLELVRAALRHALSTETAASARLGMLPTYKRLRNRLGDAMTLEQLRAAVQESAASAVDVHTLSNGLQSALRALTVQSTVLEHVASDDTELGLATRQLVEDARDVAQNGLDNVRAYQLAMVAAFVADLNTRNLAGVLVGEAETLRQLVHIDNANSLSADAQTQARKTTLRNWIANILSLTISGDTDVMYKNILLRMGGPAGGAVPESHRAPFLENVTKLAHEFTARSLQDAYDVPSKNRLRTLFTELLYTPRSDSAEFNNLVTKMVHGHGAFNRFTNLTDDYLLSVAQAVLDAHPTAAATLKEFSSKSRSRASTRVVAGNGGAVQRRQAIDYVTRDPMQVKRLLMRTRMTTKTWALLGRHGLVLPASQLIARPWVAIVAISGMLLKAGADTALMCISNAVVAYAEELYPLKFKVQVQFNANLLVHEPGNLIYLPDIFPSHYKEGGGVRYNNITDNPSIFYSNTVERADLLAFMVPYNWLPEEAFVPIHGQMCPKVTIVDNQKDAYPTASVYREIWGINPYVNTRDMNDNMYSYEKWGRKAPILEWRLDRGYYRYTAYSVTKQLCEERDVIGEDPLGRKPTVGDVGYFGHATEFAGGGMTPLGRVHRNPVV
jgi:hypothetical protein